MRILEFAVVSRPMRRRAAIKQSYEIQKKTINYICILIDYLNCSKYSMVYLDLLHIDPPNSLPIK